VFRLNAATVIDAPARVLSSARQEAPLQAVAAPSLTTGKRTDPGVAAAHASPTPKPAPRAVCAVGDDDWESF